MARWALRPSGAGRADLPDAQGGEVHLGPEKPVYLRAARRGRGMAGKRWGDATTKAQTTILISE